MGDVLVIGPGPLPDPESEFLASGAIRAWQMAEALSDASRRVHLLTLGRSFTADAATSPRSRNHEGLPYRHIPGGAMPDLVRALGDSLKALNPSCILAVGAWAAHVASQARTQLPLWVDLADAAMPAAQTEAGWGGGDSPVEEAWALQQSALMRADKISAASMPHLFFLLGQLGALGRLNRHTAAHHFTHHIPLAFHPAFARPPAAASAPLRRAEIPGDAFAALWCGPIESWSDPDTLFAGLEKAMSANARIRFVASAAEPREGDYNAWRRFRSRVEKSPHASRYHILRGVRFDRLTAIFRECDLGLVVEGKRYETLFASRARLIHMMTSGLPVAATLGSEASHILQEEKIGLCFPVGDPDGLAEAILANARQPQALRSMGQRGRAYVLQHFSPSALCQAVVEWTAQPQLAPDNAEKRSLLPVGGAFQEVAINALQETQIRLAGADLKALFQAKIDVDAIRRKSWYRIGSRAKRRTLGYLQKWNLVP